MQRSLRVGRRARDSDRAFAGGKNYLEREGPLDIAHWAFGSPLQDFWWREGTLVLKSLVLGSGQELGWSRVGGSAPLLVVGRTLRPHVAAFSATFGVEHLKQST